MRHIAGLACALTLAACQPAPAHRHRLERLPIPGLLVDGRPDVGPVERAAPPGAMIPRDGEQLRAWLADPQGPTEIWLDARTYAGDFAIKRPMSLHGVGPGTVLQGSGTGTVLLVETDGAAVENLTIRGTGGRHTTEDAAIRAKGTGHRLSRLHLDGVLFGASMGSCKGCRAERLHVVGLPGDDAEMRGDGIKLWESDDSVVEHCLVENVRDVVVWYSRRVTLDANIVRGSRYGSHFMYAHDSAVRRSAVIDNVVGIFVMYSARLKVEGNVLAGAGGAAGVGLGFKDSDDVEVRDNWVVGNTSGVYLDSTPMTPDHPVTFQRNVIALNDVGLRFHAQPRGVSIVGNDLHENARVGQVDGGGDATTADLRDNYWSDYAGYDLDDDGVGDVAHEVKRLSSELTDERPALKLFDGTAALVTLDAMARAVPVLSTRLLLRDPSPRLSPHKLENM